MQLNSLQPSATPYHGRTPNTEPPFLKALLQNDAHMTAVEQEHTWNLDIMSKCFFMSVPRTMLVLF